MQFSSTFVGSLITLLFVATNVASIPLSSYNDTIVARGSDISKIKTCPTTAQEVMAFASKSAVTNGLFWTTEVPVPVVAQYARDHELTYLRDVFSTKARDRMRELCGTHADAFVLMSTAMASITSGVAHVLHRPAHAGDTALNTNVDHYWTLERGILQASHASGHVTQLIQLTVSPVGVSPVVVLPGSTRLF